jgi:hypothetical protein
VAVGAVDTSRRDVGTTVGASQAQGSVGATEGSGHVGAMLGVNDGAAVGTPDGDKGDAIDGCAVGALEGDTVGPLLGACVGVRVGLCVSPGTVGDADDGATLGVGAFVGVNDVGPFVGTSVGTAVGWPVHALQCAGHTRRTGLDEHPTAITRASHDPWSGPESGHDGVGGVVVVGRAVGDTDGAWLGAILGTSVGCAVDGCSVGARVGALVGLAVTSAHLIMSLTTLS